MENILFWVLLPYDALVVQPYFWLKAALGIATGLFIPGRIFGLLACALGNAAIVSYSAFAAGRLGSFFSPGIPNLTTLSDQAMVFLIWFLMTSIFLFVGVVWWFVGRIMRWAFYKVLGHAHASAS
jgi:hypothetical protein